MTVTGVTTPSAPNTWLIPSFLPMIPLTISVHRRPRRLLVLLAERLDLHVDPGRQIELHERVDGLRGRLEDVDQALVGADLELLARLLVDVRRAVHGPLVLLGRQRNRARQPGAGALGRVHDLGRRL